MKRLPVGASVSWSHYSRGVRRVLSGTVICFVPGGDVVDRPKIGVDAPLRRARFTDLHDKDRYIVKSKDGTQFYAPFADGLELSNDAALVDDGRRTRPGVEFDSKTGTLTTTKTDRPYSPEEMLELAGMDPREWKIIRVRINHYPANAGEGQVLSLFQTRVDVEPNPVGVLVNKYGDELLAQIRAEGAMRVQPPVSRQALRVGEPVLWEYLLLDAHFGSLAWGKEVGEDYDLYLAEQAYREGFEDLTVKMSGNSAYRPERIAYVVGQDLFHTDILIGGKGGATHKGTPQDVDSRWQKAFMRVRKMVTELALQAAQEIAPVDIIINAGNHDTQKSWYLGEVLDATFASHPHIRVDNRPIRRKYYRYARNLLGFTHGDEEKGQNLGQLMSQEARQDWGETLYREWHMGHLHKDWSDERMGVRSRISPALCPADAWHNQKAFVQNIRGARGIVWTREDGIASVAHYNLPPSPEHLARIGPLLRGDEIKPLTRVS